MNGKRNSKRQPKEGSRLGAYSDWLKGKWSEFEIDQPVFGWPAQQLLELLSATPTRVGRYLDLACNEVECILSRDETAISWYELQLPSRAACRDLLRQTKPIPTYRSLDVYFDHCRSKLRLCGQIVLALLSREIRQLPLASLRDVIRHVESCLDRLSLLTAEEESFPAAPTLFTRAIWQKIRDRDFCVLQRINELEMYIRFTWCPESEWAIDTHGGGLIVEDSLEPAREDCLPSPHPDSREEIENVAHELAWEELLAQEVLASRRHKVESTMQVTTWSNVKFAIDEKNAMYLTLADINDGDFFIKKDWTELSVQRGKLLRLFRRFCDNGSNEMSIQEFREVAYPLEQSDRRKSNEKHGSGFGSDPNANAQTRESIRWMRGSISKHVNCESAVDKCLELVPSTNLLMTPMTLCAVIPDDSGRVVRFLPCSP